MSKSFSVQVHQISERADAEHVSFSKSNEGLMRCFRSFSFLDDYSNHANPPYENF